MSSCMSCRFWQRATVADQVINTWSVSTVLGWQWRHFHWAWSLHLFLIWKLKILLTCYRLGGKTAAVLRLRTLLSYCAELLVCTYCKFYYAVFYHCNVFCKKLTAPLSLWEMYNQAKNNSCSLKLSCCLFILPKTRWASGENCKTLELDFWYFYHPKSLDIMELN